MNILDKSVFVSIAIIYNIFVHYITNLLYKNQPYEDKFESSTTFIFCAGVFALVLSKLLNKKTKYTESVLSMGLCLGGILLILTALCVNWNNIPDNIKLFISGSAFFSIIYYAYKYDNN